MKKKTIEKILRGQFARYLKSITDKQTQDLVRQNSIITGGAIVSLLLDEKVNDFDVYFTNQETVLAVAEYYRNKLIKEDMANEMISIIEEGERVKFKIPSSGIVRVDKAKRKGDFNIAFVTDNAISLTNDIQLILRFYGDAAEIHRNYDFAHVKSYWTSSDGKLYLNPFALECIMTKELRYIGSLYPVASLFRLRKFLSRGWTISAGDILKIAYQVSKLDLDSRDILYDQLIGVDIHYFNFLIYRMNKDLKEGNIAEISSDYLCRLVDEIFHDNSEFDVENYLNKSDNEPIHEDS